jgi:hypothetical protein
VFQFKFSVGTTPIINRYAQLKKHPTTPDGALNTHTILLQVMAAHREWIRKTYTYISDTPIYFSPS